MISQEEMKITPLNKGMSSKAFMDATLTFKPDDYCPLYDNEDFDISKNDPFHGEVFTKPDRTNEIDLCREFLEDKYETNMYEEYGRRAYDIEDSIDVAISTLKDAGYEMVPIYGKETGKFNKDGKPEIEYSLKQEAGMKQYGYAMMQDDRSKDVEKLFVDRVNGKDITLHATKVYDKNQLPEKEMFAGLDAEKREDKLFDFVIEGGKIIPESEVKYEFNQECAKDILAQAKQGKDFAHLPMAARQSKTISMIVVANHPEDLNKVKSMVDKDFVDGVVRGISANTPFINESIDLSKKLLNSLESVKPDLIPITSANLLRTNCIGIKNLPEIIKHNPQVYVELIKMTPDLLNKGEVGHLKLSDIPKNMLEHTSVATAIASQINPEGLYKSPKVKFEKLPDALQNHPVILGREVSRNLHMIDEVPQEMKNNPEFLKSLFAPLQKEQFPEAFNALYGGIQNAPKMAKEAAVSKVYISANEAKQVLASTFGKDNAVKMITEAQKYTYGKDFQPNLKDEGRGHVSGLTITMDATGKLHGIEIKLHNATIPAEPGEHSGWNSTSHYETNLPKPTAVQCPKSGCNKAKEDISKAMGGEKAPIRWEKEQPRDVSQQLSNKPDMPGFNG